LVSWLILVLKNASSLFGVGGGGLKFRSDRLFPFLTEFLGSAESGRFFVPA
jgi:hypothetical protein